MTRTKITTKSEITVVYFTDDRLRDAQVVSQVGEELRAAVRQALHKKLLVSFHNVRYLASVMIGELVMLNKACEAAGVDLKFCEVSPNILEVFKITRVHKLVDIQASEEKALRRFGKKRFLSFRCPGA